MAKSKQQTEIPSEPPVLKQTVRNPENGNLTHSIPEKEEKKSPEERSDE
jgi:hypothetical protein